MFRIAWIVLGILLSTVASTASNAVEPAEGIWASNGKRLYSGLEPLQPGVVSSNGRMIVRASSTGLAVVRNEQAVGLGLALTPGLAEALWSPDSKYLSITTSDGGVVGTWDVALIDVRSRGVPKVESLRSLIEKRLPNLTKCEQPEAVNIGAIGWEPRTGYLRMIVEVPPHSSCSNMAAIKGITVDISRSSVIRVLTEDEVFRQWKKELGLRFANVRHQPPN
jgi:hypothetical protein